MTILQAIVLGIVQGLTEFIPISSTAHLIFAGRFLQMGMNAEQQTAMIAVIQLGTLVAVIAYFATDLWNIAIAFLRDHMQLLSGNRDAESGAGESVWRRFSSETRLGWLVILGSIPIGVVGLLFRKQIESALTKNLWLIATMMILIALLLLVAEKIGRRERTLDKLGFIDAAAVGLTQVLALIPGASRSGSTLMGGLFAGETRETAARFSFLLSIPAIAASGLLQSYKAFAQLPPNSTAPLLIATVVAGIVGYASIWFLLRFLRTHSTMVFIIYRIIVGAAILALLASNRIHPI